MSVNPEVDALFRKVMSGHGAVHDQIPAASGGRFVIMYGRRSVTIY